jgi:hypothetical protein
VRSATLPAMLRAPLAILALAVALAAVGCGEDEAEAPPEVPRKPETVDKLPKLPRGFEEEISRVNGLAFGRPPGWKVSERRTATLLRAPDELVVMSLSADRTDEAVGAEPRELAVRTFQVLEGYKGDLDPSEPKPFKHPYEAFEVRGEGVAAATGVPQRLRVIVLKREGMTVVTAVIAENAREKAPFEVDQALEVVGTVRTRPVG